MRKPVRAMFYYEWLSLRTPALLVLLVLPALALLCIDFFFSEALPSSRNFNSTEMIPLNFNKLEGNLFNYFPNDGVTASEAALVVDRIREVEAEEVANHTIPREIEFPIQGFPDYRRYQLNMLFDVLNQTKIPFDTQLARYNVTANEYAELEQYFQPSLFSIYFEPGNISISYNVTQLERLNEEINESLTMLTYHRYFANKLGPFLQKLILEALGTQRFELHAHPSYEVIYSEFDKIDRASFEAAIIIFFTSVAFFTARDRGREHRILRIMSMNEVVYWMVRAISTLVYAALGVALLLFVANYQRIASFQGATIENMIILGAMLAIAGSGGALLLSAIFGGTSVVFPLVITMINGLVANFILEIVVYDILAGESVFDPTLLPPGLLTALTYMEYSFSAFYALDLVSVGLGARLCREQNTVPKMCYFTIISLNEYLFIVLAQFAVYFVLTLLIAYIKREADYPGCACLCRRVRGDNTLEIMEITHKYNKKTKVLDNLEFEPGGRFSAGLVGLSGAGKTTLLKILSGALKPTSFRGNVYGHNLSRRGDLYRLREIVGYCPQENSNVFMNFSVHQNVKIAGLIKGQENSQNLLGLIDEKHERADSLSGGELRRLALLNAIQGNNILLIFDEITSGLDPLTCEAIDSFLRSLQPSYVLSTHDMEQAEDLTNHILILKQGRFAVNELVENLIEASNYKAVKVFAEETQHIELIRAFMTSFGGSVKVVYATRRYFYVRVLLDDEAEISDLLHFLELKREEGELQAFTLEYNDFTDIVCSHIEEEDFKFSEAVNYEAERKRSTFSTLESFYGLMETKEMLVPFYVVISACCLLFVLLTYLLEKYVSQYIGNELETFESAMYASLGKDCMACCGIEPPEGGIKEEDYPAILEALQTCPSGCYAGASSSYFTPGACSELAAAFGGDIQNPPIYVANDGASSFYSGEQFYDESVGIIDDGIAQKMSISSNLTYEGTNVTLECAMFIEKCRAACAGLSNAELCAQRCGELANGEVSSEYDKNEGYGICIEKEEYETQFVPIEGTIQKLQDDIFNRELHLNQSYCHVDHYSDQYAKLQTVEEYKSFNRSYISFQNDVAHIYSYMPYFFGVSAFNDEFKANCSVTRYTARENISASPLQPDFFDKVFQEEDNYFGTYAYYHQDMQWHSTGELYASVGNGKRVDFFDGVSFELLAIYNGLLRLPTAKEAELYASESTKAQGLVMQAEAYPYFASVFPSNSYAMFTNQVYMIILTIPFCFIGVKLAVDLAHQRENKQFVLLNYHNVSEREAVLAEFYLRIFEILPVIILQSVLSFVAGMIQTIGIIYLILYEFIIAVYSCIVGLFVYRCGISSGRATFASAILLIMLNFISMFLFETNFFVFLFPYVQAVQRLQRLDNVGRNEWVFFLLELAMCAVELTALEQEFEQSASLPVIGLDRRIIDKYETPPEWSDADVSVRDLRVCAGSKQILYGVSFDVPAGSALGLLGLSGSGKTTTLNAVVGEQISDGRVYFNGKAVRHGHCGVCFVPEFDILFEELSIRQHIAFFARLHGIKSDNIIEFLGLENCKNRRAGQLSGGQRRRLSFAIACMSGSGIMACDEASTGLSPDLRRRMWSLISAREGTQIITTHDMREVESLCDVLVVMKEGRVAVYKELHPENREMVRIGGKLCELRGEDLARSLKVVKTRARAQPRELARQFLQWIQ